MDPIGVDAAGPLRVACRPPPGSGVIDVVWQSPALSQHSGRWRFLGITVHTSNRDHRFWAAGQDRSLGGPAEDQTAAGGDRLGAFVVEDAVEEIHSDEVSEMIRADFCQLIRSTGQVKRGA